MGNPEKVEVLGHKLVQKLNPENGPGHHCSQGLDWKQIATSAGDLGRFKESIVHLSCKRRPDFATDIMGRSDLHWWQFGPKFLVKNKKYWENLRVPTKDASGST